MDSVYKSIGILCICGYITGVIVSVSPVNYTSKSIRLICALYVIISVLSPIKNISLQTDFDFEYPENQNINVQDYVVNQAAYSMENSVKEILKNENMAYNSVNVHIHEENGVLSVRSIEITGIDNVNRNKVTDLLKEFTTEEYIIFGE